MPVSSDIEYTIIRRARRKTLCISICPDNSVHVLAPLHLSETGIASFVREKSAWIRKKQHFNSHIRAPVQSKAFVSGETFMFLGEAYRLTLKAAPNNKVERYESILMVSLPNIHDTARIAALIEQWYIEQAENILVNLCQKHASTIGVRFQSIGIKAYKSRWGTCHHDGRIYFNWCIIMAPLSVITYIAVHEICHLVHHNHSRQFWQLVGSILPDYRESKRWLQINGLSLSL